VHEEVYVAAFAVELDQFCFEVGADRPHDFFATSKDLAGERSARTWG
jgi:hypothetical protein